MTDIIGGVLMAVGGGLLSGANLMQLRAIHLPTRRAKDLGWADVPVPIDRPMIFTVLLEQLD